MVLSFSRALRQASIDDTRKPIHLEENFQMSKKPLWQRIVCVFLLGFIAAVTEPEMASAQTALRINADQRRSIGGISTLDRERYFTYTETIVPPNGTNIGDLRDVLTAPGGLNMVTGRISTELDSIVVPFGQSALPEDPSRPGFIDPTALRSQINGSYRNFLTTSTRYEPLRENANDFVVTSGRSFDKWPQYFRTNYAADGSINSVSNFFPNPKGYAEFLNIFLDEAVYGPNSFYPVDTDRFHIELLNEPDLHFQNNTTRPDEPDRQGLIDYHREVAQLVKAQHPNVSIGGPGLAITNFSGDNFERWENFSKPFIQQTVPEVDFFSLHPYERYDVQNDGSVERQVLQSPGRVSAQLDLIRNEQLVTHGEAKPVSLTEYGSFNFSIRNSDPPDYGNYARDEQQWDLSRDVREQLLIYLNRPDVVLNATPFIAPVDFRNETPTNAVGDNVLFEKDAAGDWSETIVGNTFRAFAPVQGHYIGIDGLSGDLQSAAFRDGDKVYLLLNNLLETQQQLDLDVLVGNFGTITSVSADRIFRTAGGVNTYLQDVDLTNSFENLVLNAQEGAVLTFTLDDPAGTLVDIAETTFFGDQTVADLATDPTISIDAEIQDAAKAILRLGYSLPSESPEAFTALINGNQIMISAGAQGIDDGDGGFFSREIEVPLAFLVDGTNVVQLDFADNQGFFSTAALVVTSTVAVPEPSALAMMMLGVTSFSLCRRRV